jgi:hypothetical protein
MAAVSALFMAAMLVSQGNFKLPVLTQTGDSSLDFHSVNWLGAFAFIGAVLICLA